jgi:transcriptional regulator with XRE-family HTH domain
MDDLIVPNRSIDWQQLVRSLRALGMTQTSIAAAVGCSQAHISDLERGICGKNVGWPLAVKLLELQQKSTALAISDGRPVDQKGER